MKAIVYHGPGNKAWEEVPEPTVVDDTDAIVRVDAVTICGTDLHILKGDVPDVTDGRILGHEAVGTVDRGRRRASRPSSLGDRVLVSCITVVRPVPVLPGGPLRPVPRRRRLDPRPPDRRHPGRVRPGSVRRHLDLPGPAGVADEAVADAGRHPADRLRGRRAERARPSRRRRRRGRGRPDRSGRDHRRHASTARRTSSRSTWPTPGSRPPSSSAPTSSINNGREDAPQAVLPS